MKAVRLVTFVMFVTLFIGQPSWAQDVADSTADNMVGNSEMNEAQPEVVNEEPLPTEFEVKPYDGFVESNEQMANETNEMVSDPLNDAAESANTVVSNEAEPVVNATNEAVAPVETDKKVETKEVLDPAIVDVIKANIKERSKASGKLDLYDGKTNKVRTLDLIELKAGLTKDGDLNVVKGDFRDTTTGDVVSLDIKLTADNSSVKDMVIASVAAPTAKEVKKNYTDEETNKFMQEYIDTQSQATGTFDLYDEKTQKMRNLQFVKLDEKLRRYGIIAIATAEFKDKNTGDKVMVDVNTENKDGLSVTAMRLKGVSKPAPQQ